MKKSDIPSLPILPGQYRILNSFEASSEDMVTRTITPSYPSSEIITIGVNMNVLTSKYFDVRHSGFDKMDNEGFFLLARNVAGWHRSLDNPVLELKVSITTMGFEIHVEDSRVMVSYTIDEAAINRALREKLLRMKRNKFKGYEISSLGDNPTRPQQNSSGGKIIQFPLKEDKGGD